jgi:hypothetical protein
MGLQCFKATSSGKVQRPIGPIPIGREIGTEMIETTTYKLVVTYILIILTEFLERSSTALDSSVKNGFRLPFGCLSRVDFWKKVVKAFL